MRSVHIVIYLSYLFILIFRTILTTYGEVLNYKENVIVAKIFSA